MDDYREDFHRRIHRPAVPIARSELGAGRLALPIRVRIQIKIHSRITPRACEYGYTNDSLSGNVRSIGRAGLHLHAVLT